MLRTTIANRSRACCTQVKSRYKVIEKQWSNRQMEAYLTDVLTTMEAHRKRGVRAGDTRYKILYSRVDERIKAFCLKYNVSRLEIEAQVPALVDLEKLATDPEPTRVYFGRLGLVFSLIVGIPVSLTTLGFTTGVIQFFYHVGHHWIVR